MEEVYKEQIERVKRDQQQYQDTLRLLNEITVKREKEDSGETEVQKNSVDQKDTFLEDENKKLRSLTIQLEYDLQEVKGKLTVASEALQEEQKEKEQLQRRLRFMAGMLSESESMDQEETSLVVWNEKQEKNGLLIFKPIDEMKQRKEDVERARSYQKMLEREMKQ